VNNKVMLLVVIFLSLLNFILAIVRTYYTLRIYYGSKAYWDSWEYRSKNIKEDIKKDILHEIQEEE